MNLDYIFSPQAVRDSAQKVFDYTHNDQGLFQIDMSKLTSCIDFVMKTIEENYPQGEIPFHSRFGHFRAGKIERLSWLEEKMQASSSLEKARILWDLVIPSVLLDAGAGASWKFFEKKTQTYFSRSEGLGVASFHMFLEGVFSQDGKSLKTQSDALQKMTPQMIEEFFQVTQDNPLIGVEGRVHLLKNLGTVLENTFYFKENRPGNLIDYLIAKNSHGLSAQDILRAILDALGPIWPGRETLENVNLGDVWRHSKLGLIAFHKLSQWMTYSLIEPLITAGIEVTGVEKLTGLPEYRNGGLFLDTEVLQFKNRADKSKIYGPESDLIIEWRALTVYLLDIVGKEVQKRLHKTPQEFPLAKVLEGGTWLAGRKIAAQKRVGGTPPLNIKSDGTVF